MEFGNITYLRSKIQYQVNVLKDDFINDKYLYIWQYNIENPRRDMIRLLRKEPDLKSRIQPLLVEAYEEAKEYTVSELNLYIKSKSSLFDRVMSDTTFPKECPWTFEELLNRTWLPYDPIGNNNE